MTGTQRSQRSAEGAEGLLVGTEGTQAVVAVLCDEIATVAARLRNDRLRGAKERRGRGGFSDWNEIRP